MTALKITRRGRIDQTDYHKIEKFGQHGLHQNLVIKHFNKAIKTQVH